MTYLSDQERQILEFLRLNPKAFHTPGEVARRAISRKAFEENHHWANPWLKSLVDKRMVEQDASGHYRIILGED